MERERQRVSFLQSPTMMTTSSTASNLKVPSITMEDSFLCSLARCLPLPAVKSTSTFAYLTVPSHHPPRHPHYLPAKKGQSFKLTPVGTSAPRLGLDEVGRPLGLCFCPSLSLVASAQGRATTSRRRRLHRSAQHRASFMSSLSLSPVVRLSSRRLDARS